MDRDQRGESKWTDEHLPLQTRRQLLSEELKRLRAEVRPRAAASQDRPGEPGAEAQGRDPAEAK